MLSTGQQEAPLEWQPGLWDRFMAAGSGACGTGGATPALMEEPEQNTTEGGKGGATGLPPPLWGTFGSELARWRTEKIAGERGILKKL